jgi:hypothetical protein
MLDPATILAVAAFIAAARLILALRGLTPKKGPSVDN